MASPEVDIDKKVSKMSEIDLTNSASSEISTGFSTPPSSSLDTCDSGFNDLYSNNFSLLSSGNTKSARTTPAQIDQSDSSPESAQLFDDNSITANESHNSTLHNVSNKEAGAAAAVDRPPPIDLLENELDLTNENELMANKSKNTEYNAGNDIEDYNDDSNMSDISDLSDVFKLNADILPDMQRSIDWVHMQIASGVNPRDCLSRIFVNNPKQTIPENVSDNDLWRVIAAILSDPPRRQRLQNVQTIENVCETIKNAKNIIVLTGAGVSVSCGIPDFRSRDGIYERLRVEYPDMRDPQSMFDIGYFARDPRPFYQFAKEIYPGQFQPSLSHRFIKLLERKGKLLRNYTQNIDTLERVAGIENVIECHGSFATASCTRCKLKVQAEDIQDDILHQRIPMCKQCESINSTKEYENGVMSPRPEQPLNYSQLVQAGVMKPDIVFFGESLPDKFHSMIELDKSNCDLLIVIGSSLKVRPVALIPSSINPSIPQILINREQLDHFVFDVELLGDSDVIINNLCHMLGEDWNEICTQPELEQTNELLVNSTNVHNIPPLLANAVIKKPQESSIQYASSSPSTSTSASTQDENQQVTTTSGTEYSNADPALESTSASSPELSSASSSSSSDKPTTTTPPNDSSFSTMANYLPENSYFYNEKNCYIFPGAEIWWKDSDLESTSSDSSINDDEDDDEIDMEIATIERNEMIETISDVETSIAVENLIETTNESEFNKYLLKRTADTTLDQIHLDESVINESCTKRFRTDDLAQFDDVLAEPNLINSSNSNSCDSSTNASGTSSKSDLLMP